MGRKIWLTKKTLAQSISARHQQPHLMHGGLSGDWGSQKRDLPGVLVALFDGISARVHFKVVQSRGNKKLVTQTDLKNNIDVVCYTLHLHLSRQCLPTFFAGSELGSPLNWISSVISKVAYPCSLSMKGGDLYSLLEFLKVGWRWMTSFSTYLDISPPSRSWNR